MFSEATQQVVFADVASASAGNLQTTSVLGVNPSTLALTLNVTTPNHLLDDIVCVRHHVFRGRVCVRDACAHPHSLVHACPQLFPTDSSLSGLAVVHLGTLSAFQPLQLALLDLTSGSIVNVLTIPSPPSDAYAPGLVAAFCTSQDDVVVVSQAVRVSFIPRHAVVWCCLRWCGAAL